MTPGTASATVWTLRAVVPGDGTGRRPFAAAAGAGPLRRPTPAVTGVPGGEVVRGSGGPVPVGWAGYVAREVTGGRVRARHVDG